MRFNSLLISLIWEQEKIIALWYLAPGKYQVSGKYTLVEIWKGTKIENINWGRLKNGEISLLRFQKSRSIGFESERQKNAR